ncbi:MAG: D-glycero-alpha-D-manno-heptose-1,7-bisphosphate 7-phosphatase [Thermoplasmata archaeon]|jgi:histidinol-phosphate phosphatase family protein
MQKALFVDRDNTLNVDCPYCHKIEDLKLIEKNLDIIKKYQDKYLIIIISNQSGIRRGYFDYREFYHFHSELLKLLKNKGIRIDATYICPHRPDENCECRKPGLGLIYKAVIDFDIDIKNSIIFGDREDVEGEMANKLGIKFIRAYSIQE